LPYIHGVGPLAQREPQLVRAMTDALASSHSWFVLSLNAPLAQTHGASLRAVHLALGFPSTATRLAAWRSALASNGVEAGGEDIERIATRFRLSAAQIEQAAVNTGLMLPGDGENRATEAQLAAAARSLCGDELARLAQRVTPQAS